MLIDYGKKGIEKVTIWYFNHPKDDILWTVLCNAKALSKMVSSLKSQIQPMSTSKFFRIILQDDSEELRRP